MNLINAELGGTSEQPTVSFAGHTLSIDSRALELYPGIADRIGSPVVIGLRPEHFAMAGDVDLPDGQHIELEVELAEAMGAEVHVHSTLDVHVVELDGTPITEGAEIEPGTTRIIARVDGIHIVGNGDSVKLGVKTHLAHFFDPGTGLPLR